MTKYCLQISGLTLCFHRKSLPKTTPRFLPFLMHTDTCKYSIWVKRVDSLVYREDLIVHEDGAWCVCSNEEEGAVLYFREMLDRPRDTLSVYAKTVQDYKNNTVTIEYLEKGNRCFSDMTNSFFHIDFESILIHEQRMHLHAACVSTSLGGILFSGPSGIGKSTQADLWCNYRKAKLINGDRPILQQTEIGWQAWGSPYAGSSKCYVNDTCSVTAIIMLKQSECCSLRRLNTREAFRSVWSGLTVHTWDNFFVETASDLALDLINKVPVYEFCCTPDVNAVDFLEQELRKDLNL